MKPTFALDLSRDTIALLHRTPKGWLQLGEVAFDAPDLSEGIAALRKLALDLSPLDMACKIILPASQILYTEIHAPGPSREDKRRQIAAALEGRTPYAVEDLVFDWSGKGQTVKVAVVARETLEEAEAFAVANRLNPVSFVAIPAEGTFVGEAWFGPTAAAEPLVAAGTSIDRDRDAVVILLPDPPQPLAVEAADAPAPERSEPRTDDGPDPDDALPGLEEALNADLPEEAVAQAPAPQMVDAVPFTPELEDQGDSLPGGQDLSAHDLAAPASEVAPEIRPEQEGQPDPASETPRTAPLAADAAPEPAPPPSVDDTAVEVEEAPFAHVTDPGAPAEEDAPPAPAAERRGTSVLDDPVDDDIPPAPPAAALVAFSSRRASAGGIPRPSLDALPKANPTAPAAPAAERPGTGTAPRPTSGSRGFAGLVTAPSIPGTRAKPKPKTSLPPQSTAAAASLQPGPATVRSPARPGGTFGAAPPQRGRPGVVLMVLVALMLISLALVAAWSSYFLSQNDETGVSSAVVGQPLPDIEDEILADMQDPEGLTDPLPEAEGTAAIAGGAAALATESADALPPINLAEEEATDLPIGTLADAAAADAGTPVAEDPAPADDLATGDVAPAPAPETRVTTDVSAAQPPAEDQDEIFLAAMDAPPPALDALALPAPAATVDAPPEAPMPPPAFGTVYQFDANGLLIPTPDGILSPDGVMLIAGRPPILPPARSEAATAAALAAAAAAPAEGTPVSPAVSAADASLVTGQPPADPAAEQPAPGADPALAGFRPRPRPEGLVVPQDDDASLRQEPTTEAAGLRPLARPESIVIAASASRPSAAPASATAALGAQAASLAAQAEARAAETAALAAENPSVIAYSRRPVARPDDLSRAGEAAVAAAVREAPPEPQEVAAAPPADLKPEELAESDDPEVYAAAPQIPTRANVAKQATFANAINLSRINLIGTYGTDSNRHALIRQANGRYKKVKVGDKIDGGTVKAITETEVRYQKGGKLLTLKMPKA